MNKNVSYTENVTKNCLRADYLSNKLSADLRGWVAAAERSHWLVWPNGQSTKKRAVQPSSKDANF